jgi:succinate dehydrogenase / fumarate reductase iron-sulfur subunit
MVDRSAFDRIIASGGYISVNTGNAPDANSILIRKEDSDRAMDAAQCIGCGACVAACPNASASLFTAAKILTWACCRKGNRNGANARCAW